jgi:hypothetical protein
LKRISPSGIALPSRLTVPLTGASDGGGAFRGVQPKFQKASINKDAMQARRYMESFPGNEEEIKDLRRIFLFVTVLDAKTGQPPPIGKGRR